jgi:hypothetical protein
MHFSICLFLVLWSAAQVIWTFQYQQSSGVSILIFLAAKRRRYKNAAVQEQKKDEITKLGEDISSSPSPPLIAGASSIWILLLPISMMLSAIGDTGFALSTAYGPNTVQRDVWIWDIFYNTDHLCLAAALIGYGSFFSFRAPVAKVREEEKDG